MIYPIMPIPKPRMTRSDKWKKRPCVMAYRAFKDEIRASGLTLDDRSRIIFWLPMPDSWSKKRKALYYGKPHQQRPDLDNLYKAVLDSLYGEDSHIWCAQIEKRWGFNGAIEIIGGKHDEMAVCE